MCSMKGIYILDGQFNVSRKVPPSYLSVVREMPIAMTKMQDVLEMYALKPWVCG